MTTTYRTDWTDDAGHVVVSHHGDSVKNARAKARKMSDRYGSAYVIRTTYGQDDGHVAYSNGAADHTGWDA